MVAWGSIAWWFSTGVVYVASTRAAARARPASTSPRKVAAAPRLPRSFGAYALWGATGNPDYTATVLSAAGYSVDEIVTLTGHLDATGLSMAVGTFWVLGHILGLVILAIALHRARVLPLWAATVMALSQPVHLVAAVIVPSRWLDVFGGWGMTTLTCVLVSVWMLRRRDSDWDLPPVR